MSAEETLFQTCREWRRLAKAESAAIRRRDWKFLLDCQSLVKKLQPSIPRLTAEVRAEWKSSNADFSAREEKLRRLFFELIEISLRNKTRLAAARESAVSRRNEIEVARQNLKRLQRSYVSARPSDWVSFS